MVFVVILFHLWRDKNRNRRQSTKFTNLSNDVDQRMKCRCELTMWHPSALLSDSDLFTTAGASRTTAAELPTLFPLIRTAALFRYCAMWRYPKQEYHKNVSWFKKKKWFSQHYANFTTKMKCAFKLLWFAHSSIAIPNSGFKSTASLAQVQGNILMHVNDDRGRGTPLNTLWRPGCKMIAVNLSQTTAWLSNLEWLQMGEKKNAKKTKACEHMTANLNTFLFHYFWRAEAVYGLLLSHETIPGSRHEPSLF